MELLSGVARSSLFALACSLSLPALSSDRAHAQAPPVRVVLFTHIEDNTPAGMLGSPQSRQHYLALRARLIAVAELMWDAAVPWSLQPDWKILQAAFLYEDAALMQSTNGKNFLRYLKEDLDVVVDPHSHENGGYNYTDVAHLLDSLAVGTTSVIGGHVWDPSLPQFQEWDRFRQPVAGERYPWREWRGEILMGSGTPNHVNDPLVSGVWRPRDRDHYFEHDPAANIDAIGQFKGTIETIPELFALYENGVVSPTFLLTASYHIRPAMITRPDGLASIEDSVLTPILAWREAGSALPTDFTTLIETWRSEFGARGFLYDAESTAGVGVSPLDAGDVVLVGGCPNPFLSTTSIRFTLPRPTRIRISIHDVLGREVRTLVDELRTPGEHSEAWDPGGLATGVYLCRLESEHEVRSTRLIFLR